MHGLFWNWGHPHFWGGGLFMIIFWICVIFLLVSALRWIFNGGNHTESALDMLKKRYAVGEINKDEFELMKKDIQS